MTHELGMFRAKPSLPPRNNAGRFVRVEHSPERKLVLATAQMLRASLGLPFDPRLAIGQLRNSEACKL